MTESFDDEQLRSFTHELEELNAQITVQSEQLKALISRKKN